MKQKICIIGAGEIGRAIGQALKDRADEILFWDKDASRVPAQKSLAASVSSADFLFLCVPSWAMREAVTAAIPYLKKNAIIVSLAKGIEQKTNKSMDALLQDFIHRNRIAILGGPMLAEEIHKGLGGVGVVGAKNKSVCVQIASLFDKTGIHIECTPDMRGVALAGALKNIYAIGLGIADGLGWGNNQKSLLVVQAAKEMAIIIRALGGKKESAHGAAGIGDLIATGYSAYSRNRQIGNELVKTGTCYLKSEGSISLQILAPIIKRKKLFLPIFNALEAILVKNKCAKISFTQIITSFYNPKS